MLEKTQYEKSCGVRCICGFDGSGSLYKNTYSNNANNLSELFCFISRLSAWWKKRSFKRAHIHFTWTFRIAGIC